MAFTNEFNWPSPSAINIWSSVPLWAPSANRHALECILSWWNCSIASCHSHHQSIHPLNHYRRRCIFRVCFCWCPAVASAEWSYTPPVRTTTECITARAGPSPWNGNDDEQYKTHPGRHKQVITNIDDDALPSQSRLVRGPPDWLAGYTGNNTHRDASRSCSVSW